MFLRAEHPGKAGTWHISIHSGNNQSCLQLDFLESAKLEISRAHLHRTCCASKKEEQSNPDVYKLHTTWKVRAMKKHKDKVI